MSVLIRLIPGAVPKLEKSQEVQKILKARADKIAAFANADAGLVDGFVAATEIGRTRARAYVVTATADAMVAEATKRSLTRALDAGRG